MSHGYRSLRNRPRRIVFIRKRSVPPACYPSPCLCCLVGFLHPPRLISEFLQQSPAEPAPSPGARPRRCPHKSQLCAAIAGTSRGKRPGPGARTPATPPTTAPPPPHNRRAAPAASPRLCPPMPPSFTHSTFSWSAPPQLQALTCCWISPWWPAAPSAPAEPPPGLTAGAWRGGGASVAAPGRATSRGGDGQRGREGSWGVGVFVAGVWPQRRAARPPRVRDRVCAWPWLHTPSPPSAARRGAAAGALRGRGGAVRGGLGRCAPPRAAGWSRGMGGLRYGPPPQTAGSPFG